MGKKTALHGAAGRGESEELQRLLETGFFDINEGSDEEYLEGVCEESQRKVLAVFLSFSSPPFGLCAVNNSGYRLWLNVRCVCTDCVDRLLSIIRHTLATLSVFID
jgi:hypothetical protein